MKIKDRVVLGLVAGLVGNIVKTAIDEISLRHKISKRSFRETASGVWVSKRSEAVNQKGQILGGLFDFGMSSMGGIAIVYLLSKTGRDHVIPKGIISGVAFGSAITATISTLPNNKVRPKDAASNLSYMFAHAVYGVVTASVVSALGDSALFDVEPFNNNVPSGYITTEKRRIGYELG